jgi:hypothetical protein
MSASQTQQGGSIWFDQEKFEEYYQRRRREGYVFRSRDYFLRFVLSLCALLAGRSLVVNTFTNRRIYVYPAWVDFDGWLGLSVVLDAAIKKKPRGVGADIIVLEEPAFVEERFLDQVIEPVLPPRKKHRTLFRL